MATLVLSPRLTSDSRSVGDAAERESWMVERLSSWHVPGHLKGQEDVVIYAEALFAEVVAAQLSLALLEPPFDWLTRLPRQYTRRLIEYTTLSRAVAHEAPAFIKPAESGDGTRFIRRQTEYGNHLSWVYGDYAPQLEELGRLLGIAVEVVA
jgi:hypothetical protein